MVVNHKIVDVLDPSLPEFPTLKELKRIVLIALRCVDPEIKQRPKMGDVIHMLQPHDLLLSSNVIDETFTLLLVPEATKSVSISCPLTLLNLFCLLCRQYVILRRLPGHARSLQSVSSEHES